MNSIKNLALSAIILTGLNSCNQKEVIAKVLSEDGTELYLPITLSINNQKNTGYKPGDTITIEELGLFREEKETQKTQIDKTSLYRVKGDNDVGNNLYFGSEFYNNSDTIINTFKGVIVKED